MTFNPERIDGDYAVSFFGYINHILRNPFLTLEGKRQSDPVTRCRTVRIINDEPSSNQKAADNEIGDDRISVLHPQSATPWATPVNTQRLN
jgi:hypothetical protein